MSVYRFKSPPGEMEIVENEQSALAEREFEFSTSIHYYKRDLSPIKEAHRMVKPSDYPYSSNLQQYKGNIVTKEFK